MSAVRNSKRTISYYDEQPPEKKLESDGDLLIKELYEKQQRTQITLKETLLQTKNFHKATEFQPLTNYTAGTSNLNEFQSVIGFSEELEHLRAAGLCNEDIQLLLDVKQGEEFVFHKHRNLDKNVLRKRFSDLREIIETHEKKSISQVTSVNHAKSHKTEFGLSVKPNSTETKLLKFALESRSDEGQSFRSPMDRIQELEKTLFNDVPLLPLCKIRKKARSLARKLESVSEVDVKSGSNRCNSDVDPDSKWDVKEREPEVKNIVKNIKEYTCKPKNLYTVKNGVIVKLENYNDKNVEFDLNKRLTTEELKEIPKFRNYDSGERSKVLYLKNLHKYVKESDLRQIFSKYVDVNTTINLLDGRMKGQAFITFTNEQIASQAMQQINGLLINNKPLIIQFGRRND